MAIPYDDIQSEVLNNLDVDYADSASALRFDVVNKINDAYRRLVRDFPVSRLIDSGVYESQDLLDTGIHALAKDKFLRIIAVYVDYDDSFKDKVRFGREAVVKSRFPDVFVGKLETQPVYDIRRDADPVTSVPKVYIEPVPANTVTDGLTLFAVVNTAFSSGGSIVLDYSLRGALVYMATHLCALVDYYNVDLASLMLNSYQQLLQESGVKEITDEN